MPTLPLYVPPAQQIFADGWHAVAAPGGYEWWYFDAEDAATDTQLVAIFMEGSVFHPGYIRAYERYRKRPTRVPPPLPRDYVCAYFVVYRGGRILHQFVTQYPASEFTAATDRLDVRIGPNHCRVDSDGTIRLTLKGTPWVLTGRGPQTLVRRTLSAELAFKPKLSHPPMQRTFLSRAITGADHHWVLANPLCAVSGTIEVTGRATDRIDFTGRGYHDHNYGSAPIGAGLKRWMWGRVLMADRALVFHRVEPVRRILGPDIHLVDASPNELFDARPAWTTSTGWNLHTRLRLSYLEAATYEEALRLERPRVVDAAPFYLRLIYDAVIDGSPGGTAFCQIAYPHRLRWPVLGRMIEMSIDKRACAGGTT